MAHAQREGGRNVTEQEARDIEAWLLAEPTADELHAEPVEPDETEEEQD